MLKHKLKMTLKKAVANTGYFTGLWRLANRLNRKGRITVLTLHCVGFPEASDYLPSYMKLSEPLFERLLSFMKNHFDCIGLSEALARLADPSQNRRRNALVLTLDDGYKDNMTHALPLLEKYKVPATIFLEVGAVDRQGLTWINKFFFLRKYKSVEHIAREYGRMTSDRKLAQQLEEAVAVPDADLEYRVKRLLKYNVDIAERDRVFDAIFRDAGGDGQVLLDKAFLSWDDVRAMAGETISFGCHTMTHPILSALDRDQARFEISEARRLIKEKAGIDATTFAYPWGRNWDFTDVTVELLKEEGLECALIMDNASLFPGRCDFFRLSRYPVHSDLNVIDISAQASGFYGWFGNRFGV